MGGALGLAVLASLAAARTGAALETGIAQAVALNAGYRAAFLAGTGFAVLAALLGGLLLRPRQSMATAEASPVH